MFGILVSQVVDVSEQLFHFKEKFYSSASDSFLPPNTVQGNDPIIIPTNKITIEAVRFGSFQLFSDLIGSAVSHFSMYIAD